MLPGHKHRTRHHISSTTSLNQEANISASERYVAHCGASYVGAQAESAPPFSSPRRRTHTSSAWRARESPDAALNAAFRSAGTFCLLEQEEVNTQHGYKGYYMMGSTQTDGTLSATERCCTCEGKRKGIVRRRPVITSPAALAIASMLFLAAATRPILVRASAASVLGHEPTSTREGRAAFIARSPGNVERHNSRRVSSLLRSPYVCWDWPRDRASSLSGVGDRYFMSNKHRTGRRRGRMGRGAHHQLSELTSGGGDDGSERATSSDSGGARHVFESGRAILPPNGVPSSSAPARAERYIVYNAVRTASAAATAAALEVSAAAATFAGATSSASIKRWDLRLGAMETEGTASGPTGVGSRIQSGSSDRPERLSASGRRRQGKEQRKVAVRRASSVIAPVPEPKNMPFAFADMRQAVPLPCRIQLIPRVERRSLVYVDGAYIAPVGAYADADASSVNGTGSPGAATLGTGIRSPETVLPSDARRDGGRVASIALSASGTTLAPAADAADVSGGEIGASSAREEEYGAHVGAGVGGIPLEGAVVTANKADKSAGEDAIWLVGEMDVSKPAYLKVLRGEGGRSDTLLVSQFGFTRGGAVSHIDLDPPPRLPRLSGADDGTVQTALMHRPRPTLLGTFGSPLLWPNEVNEVPTAAAIRLTQGASAEARYVAQMGPKDGPADRALFNRGNRQGLPRIPRLSRDDRNLLRLESDKFINRVDDFDPLRPRVQQQQQQQQQQEHQQQEHQQQEHQREQGFENFASESSSSPPGAAHGSSGINGPEENNASCWDSASNPRVVLVADGFLVPGKSDGGVYAVLPEGSRTALGGVGLDESVGGVGARRGPREEASEEKIVCLTQAKRGWFYHRAVWVVLPGGKKAIVTARARKPLFGQADGELVLLEMPQVNSPLAEHNLPWRETVLVKGPDVMFEVVDLDPTDCTVEVMCAEFFGGKMTMHSVSGGGSVSGSRPLVTASWVLDDNAGPVYSVSTADLRGGSPGARPTHFLVTTHESNYDYSRFTSPSASTAAWKEDASRTPGEPQAGGASAVYAGHGTARDSASASAGNKGRGAGVASWGGVVGSRAEDRGVDVGGGGGGKLQAYEIPDNWRDLPKESPCRGWRRSTLASGFRVRGISINPGTPGFPYVFHPHKSMEGTRRPYIALAGDCSQAAYVLRPVALKGEQEAPRGGRQPLAYEVACAIAVPGTVGSLAVSYGSLLGDGMSTPTPAARDGELPPPEHRRYVELGRGALWSNLEAMDEQQQQQRVFREVEGMDKGPEEGTPSSRELRRDDIVGASGWAKLFVPNYDGNKLYIFSMGVPEAEEKR